MEKKKQIYIGVGVSALVLIVGYLYFKHKKPAFDINSIDWDNKKGSVRFGSNIWYFSPYSKLGVANGDYQLKTNPSSERKFLITLLKDGNVVDQHTIDWKGRIIF